MKKLLLIIILTVYANSAYAATAFFTGSQKFITTVTYQQAVQCQYNYLGSTFWRIFKYNCPYTVEVY